MNGHTPGPYHITQTVWTPDGLHIPWEVLQDCYWIHGEEKPLNFLGIALVVEKATANLFAASPILLEAADDVLKALPVSVIEELQDIWGTTQTRIVKDALAKLWEARRKALAKAAEVPV